MKDLFKRERKLTSPGYSYEYSHNRHKKKCRRIVRRNLKNGLRKNCE